jgi:superfamily I DNA and/or RNA helicase
MYDWVVIEEAGKAHGIDLVLPMQAGSRWLLLGDSRQLPPYRLEDYRRLLGSDLRETVNMLRALQKTTREDLNATGRTRLVDQTFLDWWDKQNKESRDRFSLHITDSWLKTFEQIDRRIRKRRVHATGALTQQYRMHSDIGSLISKTYYQPHGLKLENVEATKYLAHRLIQPAQFDGVAIVWVNVDGDEVVEPPRFNPAEARAVCRLVDSFALPAGEERTLAVLSPYAQQVQLLRQRLPPKPRSPQLRYQLGLSTASDDDAPERAHTVDSFQGNEADIVVISLVRQNSETTPARSLGFLGDARRMNVLMSRATSLLVLVGNWEFFQSRVEMMRSHPPKAREGEDWDSFVRLFEELSRLRSQKRMKWVSYSELVSS